MMTVSTVFKIPAAFEVSIKYADSGVVMRISGGLRTCRERSAEGVSPERTPTEIFGASRPSFSAVRAMPVSGARRLFSTSTPSAFSGEIYSTRTPVAEPAAFPTGRASCPSRSTKLFSAHKNAASVLPEPVGATIRA